MAKNKIRRLNKEYYVVDEWGHTDKIIVGKVNELIETVNRQQEEIRTLKLLLNEKKGVKDVRAKK